MSAIRMLFLSVAVMVLIGIGLTGFSAAHWFLYLPVIFLTFAGITGICPGYIFWRKLGFKGDPLRQNLSDRKDAPPI